MKNVSIYGAGLAGMVAGINLAREGFSITIYERETHIGGEKNIHPSIHTTPLEPKETWDYIGIDLSDHFRPTDEYPSFWYNTKRITLPPYVNNSVAYNVERGPRKTSIDAKLYEIAQKEGVNFVFNRALTPEELKSAPAGSIIATGLYKEVYDLVGIKYGVTYSYLTLVPCKEDVSSGAIYMGNYSVDYGYSAALNGLEFFLLFSRNPLSDKKLEKFKNVLKKTEGIESSKWHSSDGYFPRETKLFWEDKILAGTLSGMIEPFWGYGVVGALISGKVASLVHTNRRKAEEDFKKFTSGFKAKLARKEKMDQMPFNKQLLRLMFLKARFDCWKNPELKKAVKEPVKWFK